MKSLFPSTVSHQNSQNVLATQVNNIKSCIQETPNLSTCAESRIKTKQFQKQMYAHKRKLKKRYPLCTVGQFEKTNKIIFSSSFFKIIFKRLIMGLSSSQPILMIHSLARGLQSTRKQGFLKGTTFNIQTNMTTYRLNRPRCRFSEKHNTFLVRIQHQFSPRAFSLTHPSQFSFTVTLQVFHN